MKSKKKVFIDDSFWVSLIDPKIETHQANRSLYESLVKEGALLYTSNLILGHAFTYLKTNMSTEVAEQFYFFILKVYNMGSLKLEWVGKKYSKDAINILLTNKKTSAIDLKEASNLAICKSKRITNLLSDKDMQYGESFSWLKKM